MPGKYVCLLAHLIWSTKNREAIIHSEFDKRLYDYIGGIIRAQNCKSIIIGGTSDHIHILVSFDSIMSVSKLVNLIKSNSTKWIHTTFPDKQYFVWQEGYGAFSVSKSQMNQITEYIKNQAEHHKKMSFQEEFRKFLLKYDIDINEKYLWE